jgi:SAM-dependent methyltransferase
MKRSLLLGCGHSREKKIIWDGKREWEGELTTLDMNPDCGADIVMDYDNLGRRSWRHPLGKQLPFADNTFDEMGAFDTLEHVGRQGDWKGYFLEFGEYHRILKPGGLFYIIVPIMEDALADPGHTRFFQLNYFGFLSQHFYEVNKELHTSGTGYQWFWKKDFDVLYLDKSSGHHIAAVLRKA